MNKEAMKLALEALEALEQIAGAMPFPVGKQAITALRQALEQPAQQEPVAKHYANGGHLIYPKAQRPWVGLTHEEHMEIMTGTMTTLSRMAAVEAKLKEKNT